MHLTEAFTYRRKKCGIFQSSVEGSHTQAQQGVSYLSVGEVIDTYGVPIIGVGRFPHQIDELSQVGDSPAFEAKLKHDGHTTKGSPVLSIISAFPRITQHSFSNTLHHAAKRIPASAVVTVTTTWSFEALPLL